jgi:hypothetical protein
MFPYKYKVWRFQCVNADDSRQMTYTALKMYALFSFENSVAIYQSTGRNIAVYVILYVILSKSKAIISSHCYFNYPEDNSDKNCIN